MLFIKHFSTFIFAFLVFDSMTLGTCKKVEKVVPGRIYVGKPQFIQPAPVQEVCVLSVIMENRD
jgi:hypothetical protein